MAQTAEATTIVRELQIAATPATVWEFLVDPDKVGRWMGQCEFDQRPGGLYRVTIGPRHITRGEFVEIEPPHRLVVTFGWEAEGDGQVTVPPGSTTVEYVLEPVDGGTLLRFEHRDLPDTTAAERHTVGWTHYFDRLVVAAAGDDPGPDPWAR